MKVTIRATAAALFAVCAVQTAAHADFGRFQAKLLVTGVLPDGEIDAVNIDNFGVPAGSQTEVTDSTVPTVALEFFWSENLSVETICCVTPHDVDGTGALAGVSLIENAVVLPATVTAKYHFTQFEQFKPYVGAGPAYFFTWGEDVAAGAASLGVTDVSLSDEFGFALQTGVDVPVGENGWLVSFDAKRYFIDTTATFANDGGVLFQTDHTLDPWVISAGVGYRF